MARMYVQLKTDFRALEEFFHVEVFAIRSDKPHRHSAWIHTVEREDDYSRGVMVASFRNIARRRSYRVWVRLLDRHGRGVALRVIAIRPESSRRRLDVFISRK